MKALILAAGQGTRLRPYTDNSPKCLIEVGGKSLLDRAIETLHAAGIDDIIAMCGYKAEQISRPGLRKHLNAAYEKTAMVSSLFAAETELNDDIIIVYGDIIFEIEAINKLRKSNADVTLVVNDRWKELWEKRMRSPLEDLETLKLNNDGSVAEIGLKPSSYKDIQGQYTGLIRFSKEGCKVIRNIYNNLPAKFSFRNRSRDMLQMTDLLQILIDSGTMVQSVFIQGGWFEIDSVQDLRLANSIYKNS